MSEHHDPTRCPVCAPPMATAAYQRGLARAAAAEPVPVVVDEPRPLSLEELVGGAA